AHMCQSLSRTSGRASHPATRRRARPSTLTQSTARRLRSRTLRSSSLLPPPFGRPATSGSTVISQQAHVGAGVEEVFDERLAVWFVGPPTDRVVPDVRRHPR